MALEKRKQIVELDPIAPDGATMLVGQKPGVPAGQFPSSDVTDPIVSEFNAVIWKLSRDWSGELVTSGAGDAYEVTSAREPLILEDGFSIAFRADRSNAGAGTLKVSAGTAAKPLQKDGGSALVGNDISAGSTYLAVYIADADAFRLRSVPLAQYAKLASPALTGTPTAPTATLGNNTTQLATTAFVQAAVAAIVASSPATLDTLNELAAALGNDANFATTVTNNLALKAPLASPTFTGAPTAPTPAAGDNSTKLATTAFVQNATQAPVSEAVAANRTVLASDVGKTLLCSGTITIAWDAAAALGNGHIIRLKNVGTGVVTLDPNGSEQIDGALTGNLQPGESVSVICTGAAFRTMFREAVRAAFAAAKGSAQNISNVAQKVSFTVEVLDVGGYYDAPNSRWTPPRGAVSIHAQLYQNPIDVGKYLQVMIYKNGASAFGQYAYPPVANDFMVGLSVIDFASGADYYEVYALSSHTSSTPVLGGSSSSVRFEGMMVGMP